MSRINRRTLALCVISALVLCGCVGVISKWAESSEIQLAEASEPLCILAPYHTITIDGDLSEWNGDEVMGSDAGKFLRITWNSSHFFIAWQGTDWDGEGDLFIYFDVRSGGSTTSDSWGGIHIIPFDADWLFAVENDGYVNLREFNSSWEQDKTYTGQMYIGWSGNTVTEISIPFDNLDGINNSVCDFTSMNLIVFAQAENDNGVWASFPEANPAGGVGSEIFEHYYQFDMSGADGGIPGFAGILALFALVTVAFALKREHSY